MNVSQERTEIMTVIETLGNPSFLKTHVVFGSKTVFCIFIIKRLIMNTRDSLKNKITQPIDEQILIIKNSRSISEASRKIIGTDSTTARMVIKELCEEYGIDEPQWYNQVRYCLECGKEIVGGDKRKRFCSRSCAATYNNRGVIRNKSNTGTENVCVNCGHLTKNSHFCSKKCQKEYVEKTYIEKWQCGEEDGLSGSYGLNKNIRNYLLKKNNFKCEHCHSSYENPYTHKTILQVHHKDGDCTNNREDNLEVLCPNCHAMTENFGSRNKNATRLDKRKRY